MSGLQYMKCPTCGGKFHTWQGVIEHQRWHNTERDTCPSCLGAGRDKEYPGIYSCMSCGGRGYQKESRC